MIFHVFMRPGGKIATKLLSYTKEGKKVKAQKETLEAFLCVLHASPCMELYGVLEVASL